MFFAKSNRVITASQFAGLRKESDHNAQEIRRVVEAGNKRYQETLDRFARGELAIEASEGEDSPWKNL